MRITRRGRLLTVMFIVPVGVMLLFWGFIPGGFRQEEATDYLGFYAPVARNLAEGNGLVTPNGNVAVNYPPGFPILLAGLFGLSQWAGIPELLSIKGFILIAMGLTCLSLFALTEMILGTKIAIWTTILWTTCPFNLWLAKQPNSEILFFPLFYSTLFLYAGLLWKGWRGGRVAFIVGFLAALSALVRPISIFLGILLAILFGILRWEKGAKYWLPLSIWIMVGNIGAMLPWELWAYHQTARIIPLSTAGAAGMRDGLTFAVLKKNYRAKMEVAPDIIEFMEDVTSRYRMGRMETTGDVCKFLLEKFGKNPSTVLRLFLWKASRSWYGTDSLREERWIFLIQSFYMILFVAGSYLLWKKFLGGREWVFFMLAIILYFWAMTTMVLSILRYMTPAIGFLFPSAAFLLSRAIDFCRMRYAIHTGKLQFRIIKT